MISKQELIEAAKTLYKAGDVCGLLSFYIEHIKYYFVGEQDQVTFYLCDLLLAKENVFLHDIAAWGKKDNKYAAVYEKINLEIKDNIIWIESPNCLRVAVAIASSDLILDPELKKKLVVNFPMSEELKRYENTVGIVKDIPLTQIKRLITLYKTIPFYQAIQRGDLVRVEEWLSNPDNDISIRTYNRHFHQGYCRLMPLRIALVNGQTAIFQVLRKHEKFHLFPDNLCDMLSYAIGLDDLDFIKLLANDNVLKISKPKGSTIKTKLEVALELFPHLEAIKGLYKAAKLGSIDLKIAAKVGTLEIFEYFYNMKSFNTRDFKQQALTVACEFGRVSLVAFLLNDKDVDPLLDGNLLFRKAYQEDNPNRAINPLEYANILAVLALLFSRCEKPLEAFGCPFMANKPQGIVTITSKILWNEVLRNIPGFLIFKHQVNAILTVEIIELIGKKFHQIGGHSFFYEKGRELSFFGEKGREIEPFIENLSSGEEEENPESFSIM